MTTIYGIWAGESSVYFPTKAAAMHEARRWAGSMIVGDAVEVTKYGVANLPKRELYCRLLNGHWAEESTVVATVPGKQPMDEDA